MSAQRPEPIAPSLAELLDAERSPTAPEAALARVWARTAAATGAYGPGGGSGGHAGNGHASGPTGGSTGSGGLGAGAGGKILGFGITKAGMLLASLLVVGGGAYAVKRASSMPAAVATPVARGTASRAVAHGATDPAMASAAASTIPWGLAGSPEAPPTVDVADLPSAPAVRAYAHAPGLARPAPSTLADERALLDEASDALARNDAVQALRFAQLHAQRFATGQLVEEREAVAVEAFVLAHRHDEARAHGARFRSAWPHSLFLPAVEASLASIPDDANR